MSSAPLFPLDNTCISTTFMGQQIPCVRKWVQGKLFSLEPQKGWIVVKAQT